jgi:apolipoprotein N-acyltransferase
VAVAAIGVAASFGRPGGIAAMALMPALTMAQPRRRDAWLTAFSYYAAASWPMIPAARNFFGPEASIPEALGLWVAAASSLSIVWPALWSAALRQTVWRVPLALAIAAVPPLGIIGWASPLSSAGILFPGAAWFGLAATALLPACLVRMPRTTVLTAATASLMLNVGISQPSAPTGWEAVNTEFGGIAHGDRAATAEFRILSSLGSRALQSPARVLIFPETVVPMWTEATELFWGDTFEQLGRDRKTIVLGAALPSVEDGYLNTVLLRGAESGVVQQRIPVPLGMWQPVYATGVPLNLGGTGVVDVAGEYAAILICYEQLLVWPVFRSLIERPTVLIGVANNHWATGTPVPRCQRAMLSAWSRLFNLPFVSATNL